jgi:hypothetical protein
MLRRSRDVLESPAATVKKAGCSHDRAQETRHALTDESSSIISSRDDVRAYARLLLLLSSLLLLLLLLSAAADS